MANRSTLDAVAIAAVAGAAFWLIASLLTGKREAWDASLYWVVVYPLAIAVCAFLGYAYPRHPWRWALILFESQFIAMCVRNGELGNLWPLGVVLFAVVALPGVAVAGVAARFNSASDEDTE